MMSKVLAILLLFIQIQNAVPLVSVDDQIVLNLVEDYLKTQSDSKQIQHILLRVEECSNHKIIYLGSTRYMGYFSNNIPYQYSNLKDRNIFIFNEDSVKRQVQFEDFYDQFKDVLEDDFLKSGKPNDFYLPDEMYHPEIWRVIVKNKRIVEKKQVWMFPSFLFLKNYKYDSKGYMIYKDGIYAQTDVPPEPPMYFSLRSYLKQKTLLKEEDENKLTLTFIIDEKGFANDVKIEGINDGKLKLEIVLAIKEMPRWTPAEIQGKAVKMRASYGLQEF